MIESYELAFRMQGELPKVLDFSKEIVGDAVAVWHRRSRRPKDFGRQCLMARRLVEAGVRFIEITLRRLGPAPQSQGCD